MTKSAELKLPDDHELLQALGRLMASTGAHELSLRRTIKTLTGMSLTDGDIVTGKLNFHDCHAHIKAILHSREINDKELQLINNLLKQSEKLRKKRNNQAHAIWIVDDNDQLRNYRPRKNAKDISDRNSRLDQPPTPEKINATANDIMTLVGEIEKARLGGAIAQAAKAPRKKSK